jgi:hypothetical protein
MKKINVKNLASRLILEKLPLKLNGLTYQENKIIGSKIEIFSRGISLQNFSSETLSNSSKSGSHAGPLGLSTGDSRGAEDQRKILT